MERQKGSNVSPSTSDGKQDKSSGKREHVYEPSNDGRDDSKKPKLGTNPKHSLSQGPIPAPKIAISLGSQKFAAPTVSSVKPTSSKLVAKAFNVSDDEEEEEMPAEARMRMKNIGRETPTSAGPNSFGKSKRGFTDYNSLFQKQLKEMAETEECATSPNSPATSRDKSKK